MTKPDRTDRLRKYLSAGNAALREYERTGIAYAMEDVEQYILRVAAGNKPRRPKPVKRLARSPDTLATLPCISGRWIESAVRCRRQRIISLLPAATGAALRTNLPVTPGNNEK